MKVAIFGKTLNEPFKETIHKVIHTLLSNHVELYIYKPFFDILTENDIRNIEISGHFDSYTDLPSHIDFLISIGGDGTFLEAITIIRKSNIPIVGINSGRLGFLANISSDETDHAILNLLSGNYQVEERTLIAMESNETIFNDFPFALNECTIQKTGPSLITIHVRINDEFLTSYWADGLIIATPTGSTAYSLSVGGPIASPQSRNFIITPIAAHNLNVRPLIIPDDSVLHLSVEGRTDKFLATLDSRSGIIGIQTEIKITRASFTINMIKLPSISFYSTLYNKLMWGADKRN